jgi:acyl-CoA thioesterase
MLDPMSSASDMMRRDRASAALGMHVDVMEPGHAVVSMLVREDMLNGHDVAHGGMIFALADTTFAIACNEGENVTLAAGADITFLRPVSAGTTLKATAHRRSLVGRTGLYDVQVVGEDGAVVAEFRGRSHTIRPRSERRD